MNYLLFTYPNCQKCDALKDRLKTLDWQGEEYNLTRKESKQKIRDFIKVIKRDEKGAVKIPTLILQEEADVLAVINNQEELSDWLQSKD